jgi:hypothetical protein
MPRRIVKHTPVRAKVFCVGFNKTGTTSMGQAFRLLGYRVAPQWPAELLLRRWAARSFRHIISYCRRFDAFQDIPFSLDDTFKAVDINFPQSKFVLTIRPPDEWYESLLAFHVQFIRSRKVIVDGRPTKNQLMQLGTVYKGWMWEGHKFIYGAADDKDLYNKEKYIAVYNAHNAQVINYFKNRPNDLLVLSIADPAAMKMLCAFLHKPWRKQQMPHLNKREQS